MTDPNCQGIVTELRQTTEIYDGNHQLQSVVVLARATCGRMSVEDVCDYDAEIDRAIVLLNPSPNNNLQRFER